MILFYKDWKEQGALPDWSTTNPTALRLATALKRAGIKNHAMHLALHDQDLKGIDPFEDHSLEIQSKIVTEFTINPWYAIRECTRLPPPVGSEPVRYRFHRANLAMTWAYLNSIFSINVISRQRGKTGSALAIIGWLLNSVPGLTISSVTKDDDLRTDTIKKFKDLYENYPTCLQFRDVGDSRNTKNFSINALKSNLKIAVSSQSPKAAYMVGRGLVAGTTWGDEVCFVPNIRVALGACIAGGTYAREEAEAQGLPNGIMLTTTAGLLDDRDASYIYELAESSTLFNDLLYDAEDYDDLVAIIRNNNHGGYKRLYCVFNHRQLGVTDEQQRAAIEESAQSRSDSERDFLSIWNRGNLMHPLPEHIIKAIVSSKQDPDYMRLYKPENNIVNWYIPEDYIPNLVYEPTILAVDPSEGIGIDAFSMVIISTHTGEPIATAEQSTISIPAYTRWLYVNFVKPFPKMLIVIENRSTGQAVIDGLVEFLVADGINPFKRLFNVIVQEKEVYPDQFDQISPPNYRPADNRHISYKKFFGFKTSGAGQYARSVLYGELFFSICQKYGPSFKDERLISQISSLIEKDGRITHPAGGHDDSVIALLLAHWLLHKGRHLEFYGLDARDILSEVSADPQEEQEDRKLTMLRADYRELLDGVSNTDNEFLRRQLIHRLKNMELENPDLVASEPLTIRQVVADIEERQRVERVVAERNSPQASFGGFNTKWVGF